MSDKEQNESKSEKPTKKHHRRNRPKHARKNGISAQKTESPKEEAQSPLKENGKQQQGLSEDAARSDAPSSSSVSGKDALEKSGGIRSTLTRIVQALGRKKILEPDVITPPSRANHEQKTPEATKNSNGQETPMAEDVKSANGGVAKKRKEHEVKGKQKTQPPKTAKAKGKEKEKQPSKPVVSPSPSKTILLINSEEPEECRIALLENAKVEDFHVETIGRTQSKGNIYKGRIVAVEANLQAAFVDIGTEKNGFLPFDEIHPEYFCKEVDPEIRWKDMSIQDYIKKGQEVLVEVVKEATGTKGANMTTYLSLPGRYLVLMPGSDSHGISRKLDEKEREKLRDMISSFNLPEGLGYIIRTASKNVTKTALSRDVKYLLNLWDEIKQSGQAQPSPSLLYREQSIVSRFLRDHYTTDIEEIIVDSEEAHKQVLAFFDLLPARQKSTKVRIHNGSRPLFDHFRVEEQIEQIFQPRVPLPSGGSIVINSTEALVAIDVNSGRTSKDKNFEESIFLANMEAAEELTRQLRLRDLGGLIVIDFIDMRASKHTREVEKAVKAGMKRDKAKWDITRISRFGILQISRQRLGPPVEMGSFHPCQHCQGRGMIPSVEMQALAWLRRIQNGVIRKSVKKVKCTLPMDVANYLTNKKRSDLAFLEERYAIEISIKGEPGIPISSSSLEFVEA